jgi:hypothetical protein
MKVLDWGVAAVGGVASNVLVRLPLGWRLGIMHSGNVVLTRFMQTQAFRNLYLDQNKAHRRQVEEVALDEIMTGVPDGQGQQVSLFYSGGADSTYSAYLLAQAFDRVHLLSFTHDGIANLHKPKINSDRLKARFGDKIVHHVIDGNDIWRRLYLAPFKQDLARYGAFMNTGACECCYLSWNAIAVVYNKRNDISNLAVGIDRDHSGFMYSATDEGIAVLHAGLRRAADRRQAVPARDHLGGAHQAALPVLHDQHDAGDLRVWPGSPAVRSVRSGPGFVGRAAGARQCLFRGAA